MPNQPKILILAPAGLMRDSLRVLISSYETGARIEQTDDFAQARPFLEQDDPVLVILDAALPDGGAWRAIEQIKTRYPRHHCLVLAHTSIHQEQAQLAGVKAIWLYGITAQNIFATLRE